MQVFYSKNISGNVIVLDAIDSKHCCKVLRKRNGDKVEVVDGLGNFYECIIQSDNLKACELQVVSIIENHGFRQQSLHIAIAPTKKLTRIEWFVEKAVEIGVEQISFIETKFTEKVKVKIDRIEKIAIAAMKQSGRAKLPEINDVLSFDKFLETNKTNSAQKFIAYVPENDLQFKKVSDNRETIILIGPEGGFSKEEITKSKLYDYTAVSLGQFRLRTETAGVVAAQIMAS